MATFESAEAILSGLPRSRYGVQTRRNQAVSLLVRMWSINKMKTVLLVEDEPAIAELIRLALADEGYRVLVAENGREALALLTEERPDLVLCDVMMPILDGGEVYRFMQSDPAYRSIPIIMMSANHEYRGIELYATVAFLNKPFSLDKLFGAITAAISHSGSQ